MIRERLPENYKIWLDGEKLDWGVKILAEIKKGIEKSDKIILFLSEESINSKWVKEEVEIALKFEKQENVNIILPIVLQENISDKVKNKSWLGFK